MQPTVFETDPETARKSARRVVSIYMPLENYHRAWREAGFSDRDFADGGNDQIIVSPTNLDLTEDATWQQLGRLIRAAS